MVSGLIRRVPLGRSRPPLAAALGMLAGAWIGVSLPSLPPAGTAMLAVTASAGFAARSPAAAGLAAGLGRALQAGRKVVDQQRTGPRIQEAWITLTLATVVERPGRYVLNGTATGPKGRPRRIRLNWYLHTPAGQDSMASSGPPRAGERWRLKAVLRRPHGTLNPGAWDYEAYLFRHGISRVGYVRADPGNRRLGEASGLQRWRSALSGAIAAAAGPPFAAAVLPALATGYRGDLSTADWELLSVTGTAHLVAISGLHVGLVALMGFFVGRRMLGAFGFTGAIARDDGARLIALAAAAGYAGLAGFSVPSRRALVMLGAWTLAGFLRRRPHGGDILGAAVIVILILDPLAILDRGFLMSFVAVAALLAVAAGRPRGGTIVSLQIGLWAGLLVPTAAIFGRISMLAPLANLLAVPAFSLFIVPATLAGVLVYPVLPKLADGLWGAAGLGVTVVFGLLARLGGGLPPAFDVPGPTGVVLVIGVLAAGLSLAPAPRAGKAGALGAMVLALCASPAPPAAGAFRATVLDVGQGLAVVIQTHRHTLVYDAGPGWPGGDAGLFSVLPALQQAGVRALDALMISHPDKDHAGGAATVVGRFGKALRLGAVPGEEGKPCVRGQRWIWDGVDFAVWHPADAGTPVSDNDSSCVLHVSHARGGILLPGDIGVRVEAGLAADVARAPVDLVVVAHHGSRTSSSEDFVTAASARWAIFAAARGNRWGFPDPAVAARWRSTGAKTLTTGREGALTFEFPASEEPRLAVAERAHACRYWRSCGTGRWQPGFPEAGHK